jgi:hypothetical protein
LRKILRLIKKYQGKTGGWLHSIHFSYGDPKINDLTALTNLMVLAIFNIKRAGINLPKGLIQKVKSCYKNSIDRKGHVLYHSGQKTQKYPEAGRAGGALFAMRLLGMMGKNYKKVLKLYRTNFDKRLHRGHRCARSCLGKLHGIEERHGRHGGLSYFGAALLYNSIFTRDEKGRFDKLVTRKILSWQKKSGEIYSSKLPGHHPCAAYWTGLFSLILLIREQKPEFARISPTKR